MTVVLRTIGKRSNQNALDARPVSLPELITSDGTETNGHPLNNAHAPDLSASGQRTTLVFAVAGTDAPVVAGR